MAETLDLKTAVSHIVQVRRESGESADSPFFFVVGAGLSAPVVPLASAIEEECRKKAIALGRSQPPPGKLPIESYSHWFKAAMPQPRQRQEYLRKLIVGKLISPANLRLAHLLIDCRLTNLVVTPNFDDFLSRALTLFGKEHISCDHPSTVERIDAAQNYLQVVHVHGTYWFYDCCNLEDEIVRRAQPSFGTSVTMRGLLDSMLAHRSPLVIGYSGWEGDVIMGAIKRRISPIGGQPLSVGDNIYWFCHRGSERDSLPGWLTSHPNVCFVMVPEGRGKSADREEGEAGERGGGEGASLDVDRGIEKAGEETLTAQEVLDALIRECGIGAPELTKDPLGFFASQLRKQLWVGSGGESGGDLYLIGEVLNRVERARAREAESREPEALGEMREGLRRSQYSDVVEAGAKLVPEQMAEADLREAMGAAWSAGIGLLDNSEDEILAYRLVRSFGCRVLEAQPSDVEVGSGVAQAMVYEGLTLGALDRWEEAVEVYDEVLRRFGDASEPALMENVARALFGKGLSLGALGRSEEEVEVYDEVLRRFGDASEPALMEYVARALVNKAITLRTLGRGEEAVEVDDEVLRRFGDASEPVLMEYVARALVGKGLSLRTLGRGEEAVKIYDEVLRRFGDASEPALMEYMARALVGKALSLGTLGRLEEAVEIYDEVLRRFGDASGPALTEQVAKARAAKANIVGQAGQGSVPEMTAGEDAQDS